MSKKPLSGQTEKESLVPVIEQEEGRLRQSLEQARAEARRIVEEAERLAAEKIRRAREEMPGLMERRRAGMLETHRAEAAKLREDLAAQTKVILASAGKNLEAAVAFIVSLVWPRDRT
jgi:vacuolar-type H+-ATPase subunit H